MCDNGGVMALFTDNIEMYLGSNTRYVLKYCAKTTDGKYSTKHLYLKHWYSQTCAHIKHWDLLLGKQKTHVSFIFAYVT